MTESGKNPLQSSQPAVLAPLPLQKFLTPLPQTPYISVKEQIHQVHTPADVEHISVLLESDKSPVEVTSPRQPQTATSPENLTVEHKSAVEVAPPGISVTGKNQVVPVTSETTQQTPREEGKNQYKKSSTVCTKLSTVWTKLSKGEVGRHSPQIIPQYTGRSM